MDDVTGTESLAGGQLAQIIDKQATMAADIAVILDRTKMIEGHETRISALEQFRARLGGMWAAVAVFGVILGGLLGAIVTYLARR